MVQFTPFGESSLFSTIASGGGTPLGAVPMDFATATPFKFDTDPMTPEPDTPEGDFDMEVFCSMPANSNHPMCVKQNDDNDDDDVEQPPYMSIEDMKNASDYDFLKYLTGGSLANSTLGFLPSKLGEDFFIKNPFPNTLTMGLGLLGLNNQKVRRDFMISELAKRGYDLNTKQGQLALTKTMGIINNADTSNKGVRPNQKSYFTPDEINYQIQQAQNQNQGNYQAPTMTEQQVIEDAKKSGGSVNQFEAQNINAGTNNPTFTINYDTAYKNKDKDLRKFGGSI